MGAYLMSVHFIGVYLLGVRLIGRAPHCVYLTGVYVMGMHLIGMHLIGLYIMGVHRIQSFLLGRTYVFAAFGGRWPGVAFLILALSGNLALYPSGPPHRL